MSFDAWPGEVWIWLTIGASLLQAVRTAAQKELTSRLSVLAGTYVRALLGLPVMVGYLGLLRLVSGEAFPALNGRFLVYALLTGLTQMAATAVLLSLYRLRNFAVANQLGKSDMIFTAVIGSALFGQVLALPAWLALVVTGIGVAVIMTAKTAASQDAAAWHAVFTEQSVRMGLFVGLMFGICNLTLREAALALAPASGFMGGAMTVATVTAMQMLLMGGWLAVKEPGAYRAVLRALPLASFVGVTSALGSIGWFTAFALTTSAHVRIVGQIEVIFTLLISALYFREAISRREGAGIAITIAGIVLLQLAA